MKKATGFLLLLGALTALLCVSALAAEPTAAGLYGMESEADVTLTPVGTKASAEIGGQSVSDFYAEAEKLTVSYEAAVEGAHYLLLVTSRATAAPTAADIVYIDQQTAGSDGVEFTAFPSALGKGTYYVSLSSSAGEGLGSAGLMQVGSFESFVPYKLGDVDGDELITANDALWALMMSVDKTLPDKTEWTDMQRLSADVDGIAGVSANDALWILEASVDKRTLNG